ncbi:MAG: hypothetical protein AAF936_08555 [Pseudomonadota bacterium]
MLCRFIIVLIVSVAIPFPAAHAHLLHKQEATLRLDGDKGYLAVAVPTGALLNIDDDGDGRLSPKEFAAHRNEIARQFRTGFRISSPEGAATIEFAWVTNPIDAVASNNPEAPTSYVIIMAGARFKAPPARVTIETDLFGEAPDETVLTLRARRGDIKESVDLSKNTPTYEFFSADD